MQSMASDYIINLSILSLLISKFGSIVTDISVIMFLICNPGSDNGDNETFHTILSNADK